MLIGLTTKTLFRFGEKQVSIDRNNVIVNPINLAQSKIKLGHLPATYK